MQHSYAGTPTDGVNEVQRVTGGGVISGGTWDLDLSPAGGPALTLIPWNVTAAQLQSLVDPDGSLAITVGGGPIASTPMTFMFTGALGGLNLSELTCSATNLTGAGHSLTPDTAVAGVQGTFRGAPAGDTLEDTVNGVLYVNTGSAATPEWTVRTADGVNELTEPTQTAYVDSTHMPVGANQYTFGPIRT